LEPYESLSIFFLAYYFPPLGGAGVQRPQKFIRYLPQEGILPTVITGPVAENVRWAPLDRSLTTEIPANVPVHRLATPLPPPKSIFQEKLRAWCRLSTTFSEWWASGVVDTAISVFQGQRAIVATMSPFESAAPAGILAKHFDIPWIADLRDPWALDEMQVFPSALHRWIETAKMERLLSTAEVIIMNTPEAAKELQTSIPSLKKKRILSITNGYDEADFITPVAPRQDKKFRIVHTGSLHSAGGIQLRGSSWKRMLGGVKPGLDILTRSHNVLLRAIDRWLVTRPEIRDTVELVFAGQLSSEDRAIAHASSANSMIRFTGYIPHGQSTDLVRTADLLFLPMHSLPPGVPALIVPGKTYEYLASGRPILAAVPDGDARNYVTECSDGGHFLCRPDDEAAMANALENAYLRWKEGRVPVANTDAVKRFERRVLTTELAKVIRSVVR
jgi:glycosyltransferase involved in cell wall biosynthesis